MLNLLLSSPDVFHILFAVGGAALGYYLKHRQGDSRLPGPLVDLLAAFTQQQQLTQAHGSLLDLLTHAAAVVPAAAAAAAAASAAQAPAPVPAPAPTPQPASR